MRLCENLCSRMSTTSVTGGLVRLRSSPDVLSNALPQGGAMNVTSRSWRLEVKVFTDCSDQKTLARPIFKALAAFSKGGTLTLTTAGQLPSVATTALGVWRHTFGHYYTAVSEAFLFSSPVVLQPPNTLRLTRAIEIVDDDTFTDRIAQDILDPNGNLIATGCGATTGTRFR